MKRINLSSDSIWEDAVGYSRAVKTGNLIEVAGTTATKNGQIVGPGDPYAQTKFILEKISNVLDELGSGMHHVIRTRMYVVDIEQWQDIGKAHAEFFRDIKPAATMIQVSSLIDPELLVEIEVTAFISD